MKLVDKTTKKNPAIPDNFLTVPDNPDGKQKQALKRLQELHKHKFTEVA